MSKDDAKVPTKIVHSEPSEGFTPAALAALAQKIGAALDESEDLPLSQISQLIENCGRAFVERILAETDAIEADGGMQTQDRKRRRSKGGVFFYLVKGQMDPQVRAQIFPDFGKHGDGTIAPPGITWEQRLEPMMQLREQRGQIHNLKVTLTGRPGEVKIDGSSVMTVLEQYQVKASPYPTGVPHFDTITSITIYYVFMSRRQWKRIEDSLKNGADMLVVEGSAVFDPQLEGIAILATRVSTRALELAKQKQERHQRSVRTNTAASGRAVQARTLPSPKAMPDLGGIPADAAEKLRSLYRAAEKLHEKIHAMETQEQTSGMTLTKRLLDQTEKQIAALTKQYEL